MKQLIKSIALIVSLFCVSLNHPCFSQTAASAPLKEKLEKYLEKAPIEKVHLHLDKPNYTAGDDIWFKAYVLDATNETPTFTSSILYIDLVDKDNKLVRNLMLPLLNGVTWGNVNLPNDIPQGKYALFAYTNWMRNAGAEFFFKKELTINVFRNGSFNQPRTNKENIDLQFLAEGGTFVEGLPSRIGFKALNSNGLGTPVKGAIFDNEGIEILKFESSYLGMGQLFITPAPGKEYIAKIKLKDNTEKSFQLPKAISSGYVLQINTTNAEKYIAKVLTSTELLAKEELTIIAHHNGKLYFESKISSEKQISIVPFVTKDIPAGIIEVTLLNSSFIPICERIVFINNASKNINLDINGLSQSYAKRSPISLDLNASIKNSATQASFSVAVNNTTLVAADEENETHILTSLLLKSDLVGFIEKPNNYFIGDEQTNRQHLDYLMLTQGWRKIAFKEIMSDKLPSTKFGIETHLRISGLVTKNQKKLANTKISILSTPTMAFSKDTITDDNGRFVFDKLGFPDGTNFTVKTLTSNLDKVKVFVDTVVSFAPPANLIDQSLSNDTTSYTALNNYANEKFIDTTSQKNSSRNEKLLKTVEIKGKASKAPNSVNVYGPGNASFVFDSNDLRFVFSLTSFLDGAVPNGFRYYNGAVYVDGIPLGKGLTVNDIPIEDIESIELLRGAFVYGLDRSILITTKTGYSKSLEKDRSKHTNTLKEVEIISKVEKAPNSANFNGPGMADAVFSEQDLENSMSLMHYLEGRIPGVQAYEGKYYLSRQQPGMTFASELRPDPAKPMDIYLDGSKMDSMLLDDIIGTNDIESVEILKSIPYTALYGASAHGVILITSKKGNSSTVKNHASWSSGLVTFSPKGFHVPKEFYSPKYNVQTDNKPDYRKTVFWEPNLITDKDGKGKVSYYNTDVPGIYRMVIEGIDADGNLARKVLTYEVK